MFVDMHGKPCAKLVPVGLVQLDRGGCPDSLVSPPDQWDGLADPDLIAIPDPLSYTLVPWQPDLAVVQCDVYVEGRLWPYAPRNILEAQLAKLAQRGMEFKVGLEAEHFLVRRAEVRHHRGGRFPRYRTAALLRRQASPGCMTT